MMSEAAGVTILRPIQEQLAPVCHVWDGVLDGVLSVGLLSGSDFASLELFLAPDNCHGLLFCECLRPVKS